MRGNRRAGGRPSRAFTLIELIVVITIIGILGTFVVIRAIPYISTTKRTKVEHDLRMIVEAAEIIHAVKGRLPATLDEMVDARDEEGRRIGGLRETPLDPWKRPYIYRIEDDEPVAICLGRDGVEGGEGEDADYRYPAGR